MLYMLFLLMVLSSAPSAGLLSRGSITWKQQYQMLGFDFAKPAHIVFIYASPFCVTTHNHRSMEM